MQTESTHNYFKSQGKRTFITERSAFAGMGKYGSRWLGDNESEYGSMGTSVTAIMQHNILGIPFVGADICGFNGDTNPELCTRWHMLGAFYPLSRNHNCWNCDR
jgi:alpha-glucosidase (family GH31 glycosyl hydrolase)